MIGRGNRGITAARHLAFKSHNSYVSSKRTAARGGPGGNRGALTSYTAGQQYLLEVKHLHDKWLASLGLRMT